MVRPSSRAGVPSHILAGLPPPQPVVTAYTLSLGTPDSMFEAARKASDRPLLKIKLGGEGAYFCSADAEGWVPAFAVAQVVDTVGAGDAFAVGVLSGLLEGYPLGEAVARGNWCGSRAVQSRGDMEGLPLRSELELYNRRTSDPNDPTVTLLTGMQRSRGIELTAAGKITGNWYLRGGAGFQDATVEKDNNGFEGKRISNVAKRNGSLFITWKPELGWYAETGVTLVGERFADNQNTTVLPGYGAWDALAGYRHKDWDVRAALNNITDRTYYSSATSAGQIQLGEPRNLVVSASYSF